jgi:hypothetical protein
VTSTSITDAAAVLDWVREDPTPERVLEGQARLDAIADSAPDGDLPEVQDSGESLAMIADWVLSPASDPGDVLASAWRESEHPRDDTGKWAHAPGGGKGWESMLDRDLDLSKVGEGGQDPVLGALAAATGFDAKPHVVSDAELDKRVAAGEPEMWRGINEFNAGGQAQTREYAQQFTQGAYFPGLGTMGNGTYVASHDTTADLAKIEQEYAGEPRNPDGSFSDSLAQRWHDREVARARGMARGQAAGYASSHGTLVRMTLDQDAKTITWRELVQKWADRLAVLQAAPADDVRAHREYDLIKDAGRFAITQGYDAVDCSLTVPGEWILLNRGALHVSSRFQDPEEGAA